MSAPKILVLGPAWVGDMVLAQSLFKTLKTEQPEVLIDVAAPAWTLPLLERMPEINQAIALPFKHGDLALGDRIRFGRGLKTTGYTQTILLTNSFKSAILPFAAGIPRRTGFLGEYRYGLLNDIRPLDKTKLPRTVDRFVTLGLAPDAELPLNIPEPKLITNRDSALQTLQRLGHSAPKTKVLSLCPGAEYGVAKRWPAEHYSAVARETIKQGWEVWLFGSAKDAVVTSQINQLTSMKCLDIAGKTGLGEAIDLMSLTTAIVSNDSGLMHVAAGLGKPLVAVYGSSDPYHTPPMSELAKVLYLALECSPCFERECPLTDPAAHLNCLKQIQPDLVISSIAIHPQPSANQ